MPQGITAITRIVPPKGTGIQANHFTYRVVDIKTGETTYTGGCAMVAEQANVSTDMLTDKAKNGTIMKKRYRVYRTK